ncbi:hypothetical protein RsTz2092_06510 [Deferribacterales bacterium RsTz2092]|nr:hypothetical protein AGMMS49941_03400 [Deferribacterales bacterium]
MINKLCRAIYRLNPIYKMVEKQTGELSEIKTWLMKLCAGRDCPYKVKETTTTPLKKLRHLIYRLSPTYRLAEKQAKEMSDIKLWLMTLCAEKDQLCEVEIGGIKLKLYDMLSSGTAYIATREMNSHGAAHNVLNMNFKDGDCIIDIGANIGAVSIYLAKKYPNIKIYAYEPVKQNYSNLIKNIRANNIPDGVISAFNLAVTKDGRNVHIYTLPSSGTASMTLSNGAAVIPSNENSGENVSSVSLDKIFEENNIQKCALLKIDCEGAEYEILHNTKQEYLRRVACLVGETHSFAGDAETLVKYCNNLIPICHWDRA